MKNLNTVNEEFEKKKTYDRLTNNNSFIKVNPVAKQKLSDHEYSKTPL